MSNNCYRLIIDLIPRPTINPVKIKSRDRRREKPLRASFLIAWPRYFLISDSLHRPSELSRASTKSGSSAREIGAAFGSASSGWLTFFTPSRDLRCLIARGGWKMSGGIDSRFVSSPENGLPFILFFSRFNKQYITRPGILETFTAACEDDDPHASPRFLPIASRASRSRPPRVDPIQAAVN